MNNKKFYIILNVFNIILAIFLTLMLFLFIMFFDSGNIDSYLIILLLLISKMLLFPMLYEITRKIFPTSLFANFFEELKSDKQKKINSILIATIHDISMVFFIFLFFNIFSGELLEESPDISFFIFESIIVLNGLYIFMLGGVLAFYISLLIYWELWEIRAKISKCIRKQ